MSYIRKQLTAPQSSGSSHDAILFTSRPNSINPASKRLAVRSKCDSPRMSLLPNGSKHEELPETKDLEGITDSFKAPGAESGKARQKKIAVLTSGGDSAGMNAAGRYSYYPDGACS